jgi:endogenous inhibitor of DNA gyrase (YacG/DUF329 family)
MGLGRCPGQDTINFTPDDVFEVPCPACGTQVEFFKDDPTRRCPNCGNRFPNPKLDVGCAAWCPAASRCAAVLEAAPPSGESA